MIVKENRRRRRPKGSTLLLAVAVLLVAAFLFRSRRRDAARPTNALTVANGGLFFCGWVQWRFTQEVFPDFAANFTAGFDEDTHGTLKLKGVGNKTNLISKRDPCQEDVLVAGLFGPCRTFPGQFPGKMLFFNGESKVLDMVRFLEKHGNNNNRGYQIGMVPDAPSNRTLRVYFMAIALLDLPESMWKPKGMLLKKLTQPKPTNTQKYPGIIYMQGNCKDFRERAILEISNIMPVYHSATRCNGTTAFTRSLTRRVQDVPSYNPQNFFPVEEQPQKNRVVSSDEPRWALNNHLFHDYQFCLCMENAKEDLYITEKILMGFLAGCIPIYYGTKEVFDIFNPKAFVYYDIDNRQPALDQLKYLMHNHDAYQEMLYNQPILANGQETIDEYFSLWNGGSLQTRIRSMMGLPATTG